MRELQYFVEESNRIPASLGTAGDHPREESSMTTPENPNPQEGGGLAEDAFAAACNSEIVGMLREVAARVTGGNSSFADDDLIILELLAMRAVGAGLIDKLSVQVRASILAKHGDAATALRGWEWRSIETAPRDGSVVLARFPGAQLPDCVVWLEEQGAWQLAHRAKGYDDFAISQPTHWFPLPPPPEETVK